METLLMLSQVVQVTSTHTPFLEGPAVSSDGTIFFSDIAGNRILHFDPQTKALRAWRTPSGRANGLLFNKEGHLLVCEGNEHGDNDGNRRITRFDIKSGAFEVLTDQYDGKRYNAPNDIAARSNGQTFFTDPCYGDRSTMELDHDSVYRIDTDGTVTLLISQPEIERPNGIALSPDENTLYVVDSCPIAVGNRKVWAFNLSEGGDVSHQRVIYDFAPGRGGDGMAIDVEGNIYVAAGVNTPRGAHETGDVQAGVYVISLRGDLLNHIPVPEDLITNVTFGGDDLKTLYITAGSTLYSVRTKIPGFLIHRT